MEQWELAENDNERGDVIYSAGVSATKNG